MTSGQIRCSTIWLKATRRTRRVSERVVCLSYKFFFGFCYIFYFCLKGVDDEDEDDEDDEDGVDDEDEEGDEGEEV